MLQLTEGLNNYLTSRANALIHRCGGAPLLCSYSSDGTPLSYKVRKIVQVLTKKGHREGRCSHEFLVQQMYLRTYESANTPPPPQCYCKTPCH